MRKRRLLIMPLILLAIGFAAVTSSLIFNGTINISANTEDYDVYFSSSSTDGGGKSTIVDKKTITWSTKDLMSLGETATLNFNVKNDSTMYDAHAEVVIEDYDTEYITVTKSPSSFDIARGKLASGKIVVTLNKIITEELASMPTITVKLNVTAVEESEIRVKENYTLVENSSFPIRSSGTTYLRKQISSISFLDSNEVPDDALESWNVDSDNSGNIKAYITNSDRKGKISTYNSTTKTYDITYYDLYDLNIISDGNIMAPSNFSYWFENYVNANTINNLELLNTSNVTNMNMTFYYFAGNSEEAYLDISSSNTSQVTNMYGLLENFAYTSKNIYLNVGNIDTSNVTNAEFMFANIGYYENKLTFIIANDLDFSSTTTFANMFCDFGRGTKNKTILDLSNWDTSSLENMYEVFEDLLQNCPGAELHVENWNTSNVTNMYYIFSQALYFAKDYKLDLSGWDMKKVTSFNFGENFLYYGENIEIDFSGWEFNELTSLDYAMKRLLNSASGNISINLSNWSAPKVTSMYEFLKTSCQARPTQNITIDFTNFYAPKLTKISRVFYTLGNLSTESVVVDMRGWNTPLITNASELFYQSFKYENRDYTIYMPTINLSNITGTYSNSRIFAYLPQSTKIYVKDAASQDWIYNLSSDYRPASWTKEDNILIYSE